MTASLTTTGIAYERAGAGPGRPVLLLLHAGIADRRMWDPQWPGLIATHDSVRIDLRGFGQSTTRPDVRDPATDVIDTLAELGIGRCHLVGASFGAGVAVEVAQTRPDLVASLLLSAPGGSLMHVLTPDLQRFFEAERAALAKNDVVAAVEANVIAWVDGVGRTEPVDPAVRQAVAVMQRRAFDVDGDWDDVEDVERDPVARLHQITVPTTILVGGLDLEAIRLTADALTTGIAGARRVDWPDVAHLPSMERPDDFLLLLQQHLSG